MTRRRPPPHLERRASGLYYWRRRWPRIAGGPPAAPSGRRFPSFALRSDLPRDAEFLAARLTALSDWIFASTLETTMPIAPELAETLLVDLVRFEIDAFERARALVPLRSAAAADLDRLRERATEEALRRALTLREREPARGPLGAAAERLGMALDEEESDWRALAVEATKALIDVSRERGRRDQGFHDGPTRAFRAAMDLEADPIGLRFSQAAGARTVHLSVPGSSSASSVPFASEVSADVTPTLIRPL